VKRDVLLLVAVTCIWCILVIGYHGLAAPPPDNERIDRLQGLGYIDEVDIGDWSDFNVTLHERSMAYPGINAYCSENGKEATLMDMEGDIIRSYPMDPFNNCKLISPYGGGYLVLIEDRALIRMDEGGKRLWTRRRPFHHDLDVDADGNIYVLSVRARVMPKIHRERFRDHFITILDSRGKQLSEHSIGEMIAGDEKLLSILQAVNHSEVGEDLLHANTLKLINETHAIICLRNMDLIAMVHLPSMKIVWHWGPGVLERPHNPTPLENGNILIFDNGWFRGWSRVVEIDPDTGEMVWEHKARGFYSQSRGSAQRLANGNTLITESDRGHVFEVTEDSQIVWEYWNTFVRQRKRGTIYRMTRL